jgi:hypothetical protein
MTSKIYIRPGDKWYITVGRSVIVKEVSVVEFSPSTVLVEEVLDDSLSKFGLVGFGNRTRYLFDKINWIEKVKK